MQKATVESVSKKSIIVSQNEKTITLTGAAVEAIAPTLKLGAVVEFDNAEKLTTIKIAAKAPAAATATPVKGSSPMPAQRASLAQQY